MLLACAQATETPGIDDVGNGDGLSGAFSTAAGAAATAGAPAAGGTLGGSGAANAAGNSAGGTAGSSQSGAGQGGKSGADQAGASGAGRSGTAGAAPTGGGGAAPTGSGGAAAAGAAPVAGNPGVHACKITVDLNGYTPTKPGCGGYTACKGQIHWKNEEAQALTGISLSFSVASGVQCTADNASSKWALTDTGATSHRCVFTALGGALTVEASSSLSFGFDTNQTDMTAPTNIAVSDPSCN